MKVWASLLLVGRLCLAGAQAATYQVGPARLYTTVGSLPKLNPGDTVEIDASTYNEVKRWNNAGTAANPIVIRGLGTNRPVFDASGKTVDGVLPNPRAVFQVEADYITLENLEFKNARNGDNGAGIRVTSGNNVTVRNCKVTLCDMGVMCDNNSNLVLEASEIASNGTSLYDGYSHNLYLGGNSATLRFCYIHDSLNGQNFKSRGHYTELFYNYIADSQDGEVGLVDATETAAPNSHAVMIGNIVVSKPRLSGYNSGRFIQFGQDSGGAHNGTLFLFNNTFVAGDGRIQFLSSTATNSAILAANNIFLGSDKILGTLGAGIAGSNNWLQTTATVPATFFGTRQGASPDFLNSAGRNFHLSAGSACRDQGLNLLSYLDGNGISQPGQAVLEYVNPLQNRPRPTDGHMDLGAYEYSPPRITGLKLNGNDCVVDFTSTVGNRYEVQSSPQLPGTTWALVATNLAGNDRMIEFVDTNAASAAKLFYRIAVEN